MKAVKRGHCRQRTLVNRRDFICAKRKEKGFVWRGERKSTEEKRLDLVRLEGWSGGSEAVPPVFWTEAPANLMTVSLPDVIHACDDALCLQFILAIVTVSFWNGE